MLINMRLNIVEIAKEALKSKKDLKIETLPDNRVNILYKNERGNDPKPFIFPHFIEVDENFIEGIGIYCGDGKLTINDLLHTEFTSKDEDLFKFILKFFTSRLNVGLEDATLSIRSNFPESVERWSRVLEIRKNKFKIYKHTPSPDKKAPEDNLSIQINSVIFRKVYQKLIERLLLIIKSESNLRQAFLRGHFAADGSVRVVYDSKPYIEGIGFYYDIRKEQWLKNYILDCLELEGFINLKIFENKENNEGLIKITNWSNYVKCWEIKLFDRCLRKKKTFSDILSKIEVYSRLENNFRKYLFKSLNLTYQQIGEKIGIKKKKVWQKIAGKQLLQVEQIARIIGNTYISWGDVIENSIGLRVGNLSNLNVNSSFMYLVLNKRRLV